MKDVRHWWAVFAPVTERRDWGSVGGRADDNLVDVFGIEVSVFSESYAEGTSESVYEEIKKLVFVDFIVCLLVLFRYISASRLFTFRLCEVLILILRSYRFCDTLFFIFGRTWPDIWRFPQCAVFHNGAPRLYAPCHRRRSRFQYVTDVNRNSVERVFREIKRQTNQFSNCFSHVVAIVQNWLRPSHSHGISLS
jgi:hypothetical protein